MLTFQHQERAQALQSAFFISMDGKENQDPTSTATDISENSTTTTEQQRQQQLSPTEQQQPVRKSISPQEYIRQKQSERETPTPAEKKSWFFDLNEDEKPANSSSSLNTHSSLKVNTNHTDSSLDPLQILASTTTNQQNDETNKSTTDGNTKIQLNSSHQHNDLLASHNLRSSQTVDNKEDEPNVVNIYGDNIPGNSYQQKNHASTTEENIHESFTGNLRTSTTTDARVDLSIASSSSQNIKDTLQKSGGGSTIVQKQTPLQLLGQTTSKLGRQISKEDSTVKSELVSLNLI